MTLEPPTELAETDVVAALRSGDVASGGLFGASGSGFAAAGGGGHRAPHR